MSRRHSTLWVPAIDRHDHPAVLNGSQAVFSTARSCSKGSPAIQGTLFTFPCPARSRLHSSEDAELDARLSVNFTGRVCHDQETSSIRDRRSEIHGTTATQGLYRTSSAIFPFAACRSLAEPSPACR
jgi:hypothetical protein